MHMFDNDTWVLTAENGRSVNLSTILNWLQLLLVVAYSVKIYIG